MRKKSLKVNKRNKPVLAMTKTLKFAIPSGDTADAGHISIAGQ
jgi:hypothetical protein